MLSLTLSYACNSENKTESEKVEETKVEEVVRQVPETTAKKVTSSVSDFADWSYEKIDEAVAQTNATMTETKENLKRIEEQIASASGAAKAEAEAKHKVYLNRVQILEEKLANLELAKKDKTPKGK